MEQVREAEKKYLQLTHGQRLTVRHHQADTAERRDKPAQRRLTTDDYPVACIRQQRQKTGELNGVAIALLAMHQ